MDSLDIYSVFRAGQLNSLLIDVMPVPRGL